MTHELTEQIRKLRAKRSRARRLAEISTDEQLSESLRSYALALESEAAMLEMKKNPSPRAIAQAASECAPKPKFEP